MDAGRWRAASWMSLAAPLVVTVVERGDRLGGDGWDYIAAAKDLTGTSRFPVGFPLVLAPFTDSVDAMRAVSLVVAAGLVVAVWWCAVEVGGSRAGVAASVLLCLSPGVVVGGAAVMSDRLAALTVVLALAAMIRGRHLLAGVLIGVSGWVRLVHAAFVVALRPRSWVPAGVVLAGLVVWQVAVKGSLLGYGSEQASFAVGNVFGQVWLEQVGNVSPYTNALFFTVRLLGLEPLVTGSLAPDYMVPFLVIPAGVGLLRWWGEPARFALTLAAVNLAAHLPYYFQSARFMLPGGCVLLVFAAAAFSDANEAVAQQVHPGPVVRSEANR